nr:uncharacterized protein LOC109185007 [Ipomoea batatas]
MQVHRYSDNLYRSFSSREEAVQAFNKFVEDHGDPSHNAETSTSCSSTSTSKDAQLFHGNNAPREVDVHGRRFSTRWVDFCEALDIKLEDEIVFRHMGLFKFQFFIFRNGERVAILDAQGDGIERNPHLETGVHGGIPPAPASQRLNQARQWRLSNEAPATSHTLPPRLSSEAAGSYGGTPFPARWNQAATKLRRRRRDIGKCVTAAGFDNGLTFPIRRQRRRHRQSRLAVA